MIACIIKAIENPYTTIIGHVLGRLLLRRDPYAVNLTKVIDACIAHGKIMEINAQSTHLDWRYWHKAAEKGLKCCINPMHTAQVNCSMPNRH
jgi:DNA polymerase (family X)